MRLAVTPLLILSAFIDFSVRGEVLKLTKNNCGDLIADVIFKISFLVLQAGIAVLLHKKKFDTEKLLVPNPTKQNLSDSLVFILFLIVYIYLPPKFGGEWIAERPVILLIPLAITVC